MDKDKKPILIIKKELFVCKNAQNPTPDLPIGFFFSCFEQTPFGQKLPKSNSGQYIECTEELCPSIDESEFALQIFKDLATVRDLTPQGTPHLQDRIPPNL